MKKVTSLPKLIDAMGGDRAFGDIMFPETTDPWRNARHARWRGAIAVDRWGKLIEEAGRRGIVVTVGQLTAWKRAAGAHHREKRRA